MSMDKLVRIRFESFRRQAGRCTYCHVLMWIEDCVSFAANHRISIAVAKLLQCTAEHLQARRDGGKDRAENIAAACKRCNQGRHRRKVAPEPMRFHEFVQQRLAKKRWHDRQVHDAGSLLR